MSTATAAASPASPRSTSRAAAVALEGLTGRIVEIEAALTNQKPALKLVGLPDTALREAQARVRSAVEHSGFEMPSRHLTVNLSPAAVPKHGSGFDVGIAVAVLGTTGMLDAAAVGDTVYLGELGLDGRLRPVPGVLPAVRAAVRAGRSTASRWSECRACAPSRSCTALRSTRSTSNPCPGRPCCGSGPRPRTSRTSSGTGRRSRRWWSRRRAGTTC
jgi:predicted ATP-dependent serine protease